MSPGFIGCVNLMFETPTVTARPFACSIAVIAAASSMRDIIQPPNMSPSGLVLHGIANLRDASLPLGSSGAFDWRKAFCMVFILRSESADRWARGLFADTGRSEMRSSANGPSAEERDVQVEEALSPPIVMYPCLAGLFTIGLWLIFFH